MLMCVTFKNRRARVCVLSKQEAAHLVRQLMVVE